MHSSQVRHATLDYERLSEKMIRIPSIEGTQPFRSALDRISGAKNRLLVSILYLKRIFAIFRRSSLSRRLSIASNMLSKMTLPSAVLTTAPPEASILSFES